MGSLVIEDSSNCILSHYEVEPAVLGELVASALRHIQEDQYPQFQQNVRISEEYILQFSLTEGPVENQFELGCAVLNDTVQHKNTPSESEA